MHPILNAGSSGLELDMRVGRRIAESQVIQRRNPSLLDQQTDRGQNT